MVCLRAMFLLRNGPNTKDGCILVLCLLCFSALEIKKYKWSDLKSNTYLKSNYAAGHALHKRKPYAARKRLREDTQCVVQRWSTQFTRGLGRFSPPEGPHAGVQWTGAWDTPGTTAADIRPWPVILRPWFGRQVFAPQAHCDFQLFSTRQASIWKC